ncbi:MAG: ABC transporter substrate-binding protein [Terriglobales bacterium]
MNRSWNRALAFAIALVLLSSAAWSQSEPIKIGEINILSGAFAAYGKSGKQGAELAIDEINAAGGVLGRKLVLTQVDSQAKPDIGAQEARRLILNEKVNVLFGIDSSSVALAVAPLTNEYKIPLVVTHAATPKLTEQCLPYVFRTSNNARMDAFAAAELASKLPYKRWANIGPDYEFGRASWDDFISRLKQLKPDVQVVSEQWPKGNESNYTPYITALLQAKPEAVFSSLWAGDLVTFTRQANAFGFFKQIKLFEDVIGASLESLVPLGKEAPQGALYSTRYWFLYPETPRNKTFVDAYHKRFNEYPSYNAEEHYAGMHMLAAAIKKAGSLNPDALKKAFEAGGGMRYDAPEGTKWMRPADHQVFENLVWGYTTQSPQYPFAILKDIKVVPEKSTVYPTKCGGGK